MRRKIGFGISSICFLVIIPTVIGLMLPNGIDPKFGIALMVVSAAIGLASGAIALAPFNALHVIPMWKMQFSDWLPFRRLMPMREAAVYALRRLEDTTAAQASKSIGTNMTDTTAEAYMADLLVMEGAMPIYGRADEYSRIRLIDPSEHQHKLFNDNCSEMMGIAGDNSKLLDICVTKGDLQRRIKQMKVEYVSR